MKVDEFIQRHTVPDLDSEISLKKVDLLVDAALDTDTATVVKDPGEKNEK